MNDRRTAEIRCVLDRIWRQYPPELASSQRDDAARIAYHIELVLSHMGSNVSLWDIGGGIGMFSIGCAALGMKVTLVDDFRDDVGSAALNLHKRYGVRVMQRDVVKDGLGLDGESVDVVTSFAAIEHWHGSPKGVLHAARQALRPGGLMVLNLPNCVDIGKRIATLLGTAQWSSMEAWYEGPVFRSHVREARVADLLYIARDLRLDQCTILGRNWGLIYAFGRRSGIAGLLAGGADRLLRFRPTLCSEIYLLGTK